MAAISAPIQRSLKNVLMFRCTSHANITLPPIAISSRLSADWLISAQGARCYGWRLCRGRCRKARRLLRQDKGIISDCVAGRELTVI